MTYAEKKEKVKKILRTGERFLLRRYPPIKIYEPIKVVEGGVAFVFADRAIFHVFEEEKNIYVEAIVLDKDAKFLLPEGIEMVL